eukprot:2790578-Rhodomonas_salina.8
MDLLDQPQIWSHKSERLAFAAARRRIQSAATSRPVLQSNGPNCQESDGSKYRPFEGIERLE